jgi:Putative beta-lactamase-inhibitor-like, PepSY-like
MKMKKNWMAVVAGALILTACGDNSTETTYNEKTTETPPTTNTTPTVTPEYNPPDNVRTAFQTKYPKASDVSWSAYKPYERINWEWTGWPSMDSSYYVVNYKMDNRGFWSWWDRNNNWIGSSSVVEDSTMLPDPVKKTLKNSYSGYKITSIDEENDKNRTAYEIKLEKGDAHARILIDKNGKILKKDAKA